MDELLRTVQEAASEFYHVYGELGRESADDVWYLGKDRSTARLVALRLRRVGVGPDGKPDYDLSAAQELDGSVSVGAGDCVACRKPLRRWARYCTHCGADLAVKGENPSSPGARAALLAEVRAAAQGVYDVLGEMPWGGGGGMVYFAVEKATQRLVRLRLRPDDEGFQLGETRVMMPLGDRLAASYVTHEHTPVLASREVENPRFTAEELAAGRRAALEEAGAGGGSAGSIFEEPDPAVPPASGGTPAPPPRGTVMIAGREYEGQVVIRAMLGVIVVLVILVLMLLVTR